MKNEESSFLRVVKVIWKVVRWPLLILAGVFAVKRGIEYVARRGWVVEHRGFDPVPGDPTRIDVQTPNGPVRVRLPDDVTSDEVRSAGIGSDNGFAVEVLHEATDRRGAPGAAGNDSLDL